MESNSNRERRKTLMACEYCRGKKIKCDGERPVCGGCTRRGWGSEKCIWKHVNGEALAPKGPSIEDLQKRIIHLETQAQNSTSYGSSSPTLQASSMGHVRRKQSEARTTESQYSDPPPMSALEGAVTGKQQNSGFSGPGSTAAFMNAVRQVVDPPTNSHITPLPKPQSLVPAEPISYALPPRREADALLQVYWEYVHPIYPFLHRPTFERRYQSLWSGETTDESGSTLTGGSEVNSVALSNLAMALACQYSDRQSSASTLADQYFNRAQEVLGYKNQDRAELTLQDVLISLLMAQYLQSIGNLHRAWDVIGKGLRTCYRLGLHQAATLLENAGLQPWDKETIKRVWHGTLMIERYESDAMVFYPC